MANDFLPYYLGFSHFLGIGPMRFSALIKRFGNAKIAYQASQKELEEIIGEKYAEKFVRFRSRFDPTKKLAELQQKKIYVIPLSHPSYPRSLQTISDPPICLYVRGDASNLSAQYSFGIVGTRKLTPYGQQIAYKFSFELAKAGFVIVSGMAMGIDAVAHQAALHALGHTIAVLGCGVDIIYPAVNTRLYWEIIKKGGAVISEFPPGHLVIKGLFIARNRLISGLSLGVMIIEGAKDSGAMITARYAAEQGREVFAPPGPLTSEMSQAPNQLLKQGAKLVTTVEDILEEFNLKIVPKRKEDISKKLNKKEKQFFEIINEEVKLADELSAITKLPIDKTLNILSVLEIKGVIEKNSEGKYQIKLT